MSASGGQKKVGLSLLILVHEQYGFIFIVENESTKESTFQMDMT
jgi:uncharacterized protein Veg